MGNIFTFSVCVFFSPSSCPQAQAAWLHLPSAAPSSSAPAPLGQPAASDEDLGASLGTRGAALAGPDAAGSHRSGWLRGNVGMFKLTENYRQLF